MKKKNPLEDISVLSRVAKKASQKAIKETFDSGNAIYYILEGQIIKEYPDAKKEYIKKSDVKSMKLRKILK